MANEEFIKFLNEVFGDVFNHLFLLTILSMIVIIELIAINMIGLRKMFIKAKKPSWAAFIPIYREWVICEMVGVNTYWVIVTLIGIFLISQIPVVGRILATIILIYYKIITSMGISKSFGKDKSFTVGIAFIPTLYFMILGYGSSEYKGPKAGKDKVDTKINDFLVEHNFKKEK